MQKPVTVLMCHLCGQKESGSVISVPVPLPVPLVRSVVILTGGRTRGGKLTWLLVTPLSGGIS